MAFGLHKGGDVAFGRFHLFAPGDPLKMAYLKDALRVSFPLVLPAILLLVASACVVGDFANTYSESTPDAGLQPSEPDASPPEPPSMVRSYVTQPRHGQLFPSDPSQSLRVGGFHADPGVQVSIEILANPDKLDSWTAVASTTSASSASDGVYSWSIQLPALSPQQWPSGGLLRLRAVDADGEVLGALFHDSDICLSTAASEAVGKQMQTCGHVFEDGMVLVSTPALEPSEFDVRPRFLDAKGATSPEETAEYYQAIDAPETVDAFLLRYGFDGTERLATYYNEADLRVGREIRCKPYLATAGQGLACMTGNYGQFSGNQQLALEAAINGTESGVSQGAFAYVAMVYEPPLDSLNSVRFIVYGSDRQLALEAPLDTVGENASIPNNCLNCHGAGASYDPASNTVSNARFLLFDPAAFRFSSTSGYRRVDQEESIRELNQLIYTYASSDPTKDAIENLYDGQLNISGTIANTEAVPQEWAGSLRDRQVYRNVVAPYCRGCHASFGNASQGLATPEALTTRAQVLARAVCDRISTAQLHAMPNAEVVLDRFWNGPARAYLAEFVGIPGSCAP
jgi:hypothetical protein